MTSPAGRAASRDLDLQLRPDGNIQESQLPSGFSLEKIESMIRELRTAAALEVSMKRSTQDPCDLHVLLM